MIRTNSDPCYRYNYGIIPLVCQRTSAKDHRKYIIKERKCFILCFRFYPQDALVYSPTFIPTNTGLQAIARFGEPRSTTS